MYKQKYLKYKNKYSELKNQIGSGTSISPNAGVILERLLSEMGFDNFRVVVEDNKISLNYDDECFVLLINSERIHIDNLSKCKFKGSESLKIVENLAKKIPNINYISLADLSDISISSSEINIDLTVLKILTKGESWYNSLGYVSDDKTEKEHNNLIINGKYKDFELKLYNNSPELLKKYSLGLEEIIHKCHELYPNVDQTVKEYFNYIWTDIIRREEEFNHDSNNWFAEYLNKISRSRILKYTRYLKKYVV
jgi:hypothetical protein